MDSSNFWMAEQDDRPALSEELIAFAEQSLQVKLPESYIQLLYLQNGGQTAGFVFPMKQRTSWSENHIPFPEMFGIITEEAIADWQKTWPEKRLLDFYIEDRTLEFSQNILLTAYMTKEWGLPEKQVLLAGEGHWWITLDYRNSSSPSVRWIDVESSEDLLVADNFDEFIQGLIPEENFYDPQSDNP